MASRRGSARRRRRCCSIGSGLLGSSPCAMGGAPVDVEIGSVDLLAALGGAIDRAHLIPHVRLDAGREGAVEITNRWVFLERIARPVVGDLVGGADIDHGAHSMIGP